MVTDPKMKRLGTNLLGIVTTSCLAFCLVSCGAPTDKQGRRPQNVVENFLVAVKKGDFDKAKAFWTTDSLQSIEVDYKLPFQTFCQEKFHHKTYSLSKPIKQKPPYYSVKYTGGAGGRGNIFIFYLKPVNDEWRVSRD
jgi:hypothetical protein